MSADEPRPETTADGVISLSPGFTTVQCLGEIRVMDGKLQQLFLFTDYERVAGVTGTRREWRDVPVIDKANLGEPA